MKKIAVVGYKGKTGSVVYEELKKYYDVVGIDKNDKLIMCDLLVDFAGAESSIVSARFCRDNKIPIIIGSTGQTKEQLQILDEISKEIVLRKKSNFANGIEVIKNFIDDISKLNPEKIEIVEAHNKNKKDTPSGTAIDLQNYVYSKTKIMPQITSIRHGEEMGEHKIIVSFNGEELSVKHNVISRKCFAKGVLFEIKDIFSKKV